MKRWQMVASAVLISYGLVALPVSIITWMRAESRVTKTEQDLRKRLIKVEQQVNTQNQKMRMMRMLLESSANPAQRD